MEFYHDALPPTHTASGCRNPPKKLRGRLAMVSAKRQMQRRRESCLSPYRVKL